MAKRSFFRYETKHQPLLSRRAFAKRVARCFGTASLLIGISLLGGMLGYRHFEGMEWIDAFANASMILSGMGPLTPLGRSLPSKLPEGSCSPASTRFIAVWR